MIFHVKKSEHQGAFHLKSSAVDVAQAVLRNHIFVAVFLCVEEDHVTHNRTESTKHGGNMSLWWSCDEAAAWQAVLAESQAPRRRGTVCLQDFFFFLTGESKQSTVAPLRIGRNTELLKVLYKLMW